jgi:hypothetical protein
VAAKKMVADKKRTYSRQDLSNVNIIPFVIEAGGRWSPDATAFVQTTCGIKIASSLRPDELLAKRKVLRRKINCLLAKFNAQLGSLATKRIQPMTEQIPWEVPVQSPLVTEFLRTRQQKHLAYIPQKQRQKIDCEQQ